MKLVVQVGGFTLLSVCLIYCSWPLLALLNQVSKYAYQWEEKCSCQPLSRHSLWPLCQATKMQKKIIVLQLELKRAQHQQRLKPSGVDGLSLTWSLVPMDTQIFTSRLWEAINMGWDLFSFWSYWASHGAYLCLCSNIKCSSSQEVGSP